MQHLDAIDMCFTLFNIVLAYFSNVSGMSTKNIGAEFSTHSTRLVAACERPSIPSCTAWCIPTLVAMLPPMQPSWESGKIKLDMTELLGCGIVM